MASEFDRYGGRYEEAIAESIGFMRREHSFFLKAKAQRLLDVVHRRTGDATRVRALDVGCGAGHLDAHLVGLFGTLEGVDLSAAMVDDARLLNPGVQYHVADAKDLPLPDDAFDLVFTSCMLHHVAPPERSAVFSELRRVTRPGGLVVVIEHNPLNPLTRLAVARCEFDEDAVLLWPRETKRRLAHAGLHAAESRYFLFLPWSARFVARLERLLAPVPLGAQYYVAAYA